ncbi:hypothetical protein [Pelomonas cellulosilytica]|uniref:Uncharacterized protein n=1 Tax=Pelomonas cellulosilytica TaxID=2906762 RepID=A0ABS8XP73_9BURK|nr:hypothetical protein [Pelomonas sp. P8]MCE4553462.1 hypothetical protein [Pelomonas sp. P8]
MISGQRTDYISSASLGSSSIDVARRHYSGTGGRTIECADWNGEQLTFNGGAMTGTVPSHYSFGALDAIVLNHNGPGSASTTDKYPWFWPCNGPKGEFNIIGSATPPELTKATTPAVATMFFYDPTLSAYYQRSGTIEAIQSTPFAAAVPEPPLGV